MLQLLPLITGLLENRKKEAEQQKQDRMSAYMGDSAPTQGAQSSGGNGLLQGAMGLLGSKSEPGIQDVVAERYKGGGPSSGPTRDSLSTEASTGSLSLPTMGVPWDHKEPDGDEGMGGYGDNDGDEKLY